MQDVQESADFTGCHCAEKLTHFDIKRTALLKEFILSNQLTASAYRFDAKDGLF